MRICHAELLGVCYNTDHSRHYGIHGIKVLTGDIFVSKAQTLVNAVNCVGVMDKGIALEFKNRYPNMFDDYKQRCAKGLVKPGVPCLYTDSLGTSILNFPTKDDWRSPSNITYIVRGLQWLAKNYETLGIRSIAFPALGCGNGGLLWEDVRVDFVCQV